MLSLANREGYAAATVARVTELAGVSRPTFYDYFADRDDCFVATHRQSAERLLAQIREAVATERPERAPQVAIRRLVARAEAEPEQAQFMAIETMAGGLRALAERDRTINEIAKVIEAARAGTPARTLSPDLPTTALIGAAHWLLSPRLRRGEHDFKTLADALTEWIESYNAPAGKHRWRLLEPGPPQAPSPHVSELPIHAPAPLRSGRSRPSGAEIERNQRERILYATAEVATHKGYAATTIADITAIAKLDRRVFYAHFRDKQQAFLAVHELAFQQTMAIAASGFFSASTWPERIWEGIHAAGRFNVTYPIARVIYLESHALGAPAIQRIDDTHTAFTIFLQEGNHHAATHRSHTALEAIVASGFEVGYQQFRGRHPREPPNYTPHISYLCLAPFLGPDATNEFIDGRLRAGRAELGETGKRNRRAR